ncbi:cell wall-binding repeat-containing protein [Bacillus timonensis]|uniref:cell wall-binding repeat-containing protein n=1 Tax=Bacillus timonensis TaxID=1033734 RepID=UPI000288405C|nr:cell wall-binding repeat-containing protein [Bacillus timonensis]
MKKIAILLSKIVFVALLFFGLSPQDTNAQTLAANNARISGGDRYETAVTISKTGWANGSNTAVIARGDLYPDALSGAPLATKLNAPILLTRSDKLNSVTKAELTRLKVKNVILLGGEGAINNGVKKEIEKMGITVKRISGATRYQTALQIAKELKPAKNEVVLATGANFPDALAIAPYASEHSVPILLTAPKKIDNGVLDYTKQFSSVTIIGGTNAIDPSIEKKFTNATRIKGKDRYETASTIVRELYNENKKIYISTGANFPDALTGSVLAAKNKTGILLTKKSSIPDSLNIVFPQQKVNSFQVFGGKGVVEEKVITDLQKLLVSFKGTIGGGEVSTKAKFLTEKEATEFEKNAINVTVGDNGSLTYVIKDASKFSFKKDDLVFFPPSEENPTGMIVQVMKSTKTSNGQLQLQVGQPAIEDVFSELNIQLDQYLTTDQLVDMNLEDGVSLKVGDQTVQSMEEFYQLKQANQFLASSDKMYLSFNLDLDSLLKPKTDSDAGTGSEDDSDFVVGSTQKDLALSGSFEIDKIKPVADVKRSKIAKKWKSFDFGITYNSTAKMDLTGKLKGIYGLKNNTNYGIGDDDSWVQLEGVERDDRLSLASFTFVPGPVVVQGSGLGDGGYKKVPVGITLFITTTLEGKFNIDLHIGYVKTDKTNMGIKWDKKSDDFDPYWNVTPVKNEVTGDVKGAIALTKKYGADVALNVGGLLPAVLENDFNMSNTAKGEGYLKLNLLNGTVEKDGCVSNDFDISLQSRVKYRLAVKLWSIEAGREGEFEIGTLPIYNNKQEFCVNSGTLKGEIKDAVTDLPLKDVNVTILKDNFPVKTLKSDNEGKYEIKLFNGTYDVTYTKDGYSKLQYYNVEIDSNQVKHNPKMRLLSNDYVNSPGSIGGIIINALNGDELEGAKVQLRKGHNVRSGEVVKTIQTDEYGEYVVENLQAGYYTAEVSKEGFNKTYIDVISIGGQETYDYHATLRPILADGEISIILTWGDTPRDLDSHLTGPVVNGNDRFHIYFGNKNYYSGGQLIANLDRDDVTSYGPETVTINQQSAGTYSYYVRDYTNRYNETSTGLSNSGAKVDVYFGNELVKTFYAPTNQTGTVWKVFDLNGTTITPINEMYGEYSTIQSVGNNPGIEPAVWNSLLEEKTYE